MKNLLHFSGNLLSRHQQYFTLSPFLLHHAGPPEAPGSYLPRCVGICLIGWLCCCVMGCAVLCYAVRCCPPPVVLTPFLGSWTLPVTLCWDMLNWLYCCIMGCRAVLCCVVLSSCCCPHSLLRLTWKLSKVRPLSASLSFFTASVNTVTGKEGSCSFSH